MNHQCIRQHLKQQAYRIATSGASRAIPVIIRDLRQMQAGTARLVGPEHHNGTRPQAPERNHQTPDRREASIEVGQAMTLGLVWPTCTFNHPREGGGSLQKANQTPEEKQTRSLSATRGGGALPLFPKPVTHPQGWSASPGYRKKDHNCKQKWQKIWRQVPSVVFCRPPLPGGRFDPETSQFNFF